MRASTWLNDLRFAMRSYAKTPGLTITLLVTLALGVGASLASFALMNTLLFRSIGVARPHELVRVSALNQGSVADLLSLTSVMRDALRELPAFSGVCGFDTRPVMIGVGDRLTPEGLMNVDDDCFDVLGVTPRLGRLLTAEDDRTRARAAVLTHDVWQRTFDGAPDVVGRTIAIDGVPFTIVGVSDPAFRGLSTAFPPTVVVPTGSLSRRSTTSTFHFTEVVARRAAGVSLAQTRAQVEAAWPWLTRNAGLPPTASGEDRRRLEASRAFVGDMRTGLDNVRPWMFHQPLLLTFGLAMLMLGVCGANVANLLVARALARQRELAVRTALGASRGDLVRQTAIEALLPAIAGALLAVPLADAITAALIGLLQTSYAGLHPPSLWDRGVAMFLVAVVAAIAATTCLVQLASGRASRRGQRSLAEALRASARTSRGAGQGRARRLLVAAQIALTVMLVGGAGSFVRSLQQHYASDPGIAVDSGLVAQLWRLPGGDRMGGTGPYYDDLLTRLSALPGVRAAGLATWIPLNGPSARVEAARIPEQPDARATVVTWPVSDGFFESMGIALKAGRTFDRTHAAASQNLRTVILSESVAARLFPAANPIGEHIRLGVTQRTRDLIVIGVAADARLSKPQFPNPILYLNFWENPDVHHSPDLLVRSIDDRPDRLASAVTAAVRAGGREFPLWTRTLAAQRDIVLVRERLLAGTSSAFGAIGLAIAAVGLIGLLNHYVTSRRTEIGIRVAVGASRRDITRLLLREVAGLLVFGSVSGLALLLVASRSLGSLLYGVAPGDPWLLAATLAIVACVSLLALAWPLRRATSIDPLIALRSE